LKESRQVDRKSKQVREMIIDGPQSGGRDGGSPLAMGIVATMQ
jgi:hypothetical protein